MVLPEYLQRKLFDDIFVCNHCGHKSSGNGPMETMLRDGRLQKTIICNHCNTEISHLSERTYNNTIPNKRSHGNGDIWKRMPLWSINK